MKYSENPTFRFAEYFNHDFSAMPRNNGSHYTSFASSILLTIVKFEKDIFRNLFVDSNNLEAAGFPVEDSKILREFFDLVAAQSRI